MRLLIIFARKYPVTSAVMVMALLLAGLMDGIGLTMLLPLIGLTINNPNGVEGADTSLSKLERVVMEGFNVVGITPTLGVLLIVLVATVTLKSGLMLLANKQVGYTVARIATDLRLEFLQAMRVSRWQYFVKQTLGSLANSISTETSRTSKAYSSGVMMTAELVQAFVYFTMAFLVSWKATLIALT
ncbi:MAG: ABC transporter ATP-binding protein, partial [bacterium]|nr:ABC transporter ATP-binding protein [bacterium]